MIKAVIEMQELKILSPAQAFNCIIQIVKKTITGTNKNFDIKKGGFIKKVNGKKRSNK